MLLKHSLTKTQSCLSQGRVGRSAFYRRLPHEPLRSAFLFSDKMTTPDNISKANIAFALSVFKKLADANQAADVFFSPFSISAALAMVMLGARGNTAAQMSEVQQVAHGDVARATFSKFTYNRKKLQLETRRSDPSCCFFFKSCHFSLARGESKRCSLCFLFSHLYRFSQVGPLRSCVWQGKVWQQERPARSLRPQFIPVTASFLRDKVKHWFQKKKKNTKVMGDRGPRPSCAQRCILYLFRPIKCTAVCT